MDCSGDTINSTSVTTVSSGFDGNGHLLVATDGLSGGIDTGDLGLSNGDEVYFKVLVTDDATNSTCLSLAIKYTYDVGVGAPGIAFSNDMNVTGSSVFSGSALTDNVTSIKISVDQASIESDVTSGQLYVSSGSDSACGGTAIGGSQTDLTADLTLAPSDFSTAGVTLTNDTDYFFSLKVVDALNNNECSSSSITYTYDNLVTQPEITFSDGSSALEGGEDDVSFTITSTLDSDLAKAQLYISTDSGNDCGVSLEVLSGSEITSSFGSMSLTGLGLSHNTVQYFTVKHTDAVGNTSCSSAIAYTPDGDAGSVVIF